MSQVVTMGANCLCSFGTGPAPLKVTSQAGVMAGGMVATIQDCMPMSNIGPFALCTTPTNPAVAAATAAALGVLTPQPCIPVPAGTWIPTQTKVLVGGKPCLTQDCKMMCSYGGQIQITTPGQMKVST